jgi:YD repeat-containing protein
LLWCGIRNGSLRSVTGTAVHPARYEYDVEIDDGVAREYVREIKLDEQGKDTPEWVKTYKDGQGRNFKTVFPDGASRQTVYNAQGQRVKEIDPDGVTSLFAYNANGELEYQALDVNQDGQINLKGQDRVTRTVREYGQRDGLTVERTSTYEWPTLNNDKPDPVSIRETTLNGQRFAQTWETRYGLTSTSRTDLPGNGQKTVTTTALDGVKTLSQYASGKLLSSSRYDAKGKMLGKVSHGYDAHGRRSQVTDERNGTTTYAFDNADRVLQVTTPTPTDGQAAQTTGTEYDVVGRPTKTTNADGGVVQKEYYPNGTLKATYGARTYPVEYTYDTQGRMRTMTTWTDYAKRQGAAATTWQYDTRRGWLAAKRYADGTGPEYEYLPSGKTKSRKWARGINTAYGYTSAGELAEVSYSDSSTPKVRYTYNRQGRRTRVEQSLSQISNQQSEIKQSVASYDYNAANQRLKATLEDGSEWDYAYDALGQVTSGKKLRPNRASEPNEAFDYQHDDIGNRKEAGGQASAHASYSANALNQYTQRVDTAGNSHVVTYDGNGKVNGHKPFALERTAQPGGSDSLA